MNDFVREEEDMIFGEHIVSTMPLFDEPNLANEEINKRRKELRKIMNEICKQKELVTRKQMSREIASTHFGQFHSKDINAVFKALIEEGQLVAIDPETRINSRSYRYID